MPLALQSGFSSLRWNNEEAQPEYNRAIQGMSLGVAAALGGAGMYRATMARPDDTRPMDDIARYARTLGNMSPFQIGNTFRAPEWLSPFTSPKYQGLTPKDGPYQMTIGADYLKNNETYSYLKKLTGFSAEQMADAGLTPGLAGAPDVMSTGLLFEKNRADVNGALYSIVNGEQKLLSPAVALLQFSGENSTGDAFANNEPVNKVAKSVFGSMDMWAQGNWKEGDERKVFTNRIAKKATTGSGTDLSRPAFIPIPGINTKTGMTYLNAGAAFSMERFNQLLENTGNELLGTRFTTAAKKLGFGPGVMSGPGLQMYGRFGLKAAGVLGVGLALNESDWIRRQGGVVGQTAVSAGVGFGLGALVSKAGFGPRAGVFAGIAAFTGQMILPGFDKGILPGLANTYAVSQELKATAANPLNYYRRTVEGLLPGVSSFGFGMATGLAVMGASYARVPGTGQSLSGYLLNQVGHGKFGIAARTALNQMDVATPKSVRDHTWDLAIDYINKNTNDPQALLIKRESQRIGGFTNASLRAKTLATLHRHNSASDTSRIINSLWAEGEELHRTLAPVNPLNQALKERLTDIDFRYTGKKDFTSRLMRQVENMGEQVRHGFFGADVTEKGMSEFMTQRGFTHGLGRAGMLFAAGFLTQQIATGALFGSMESKQELQDIYSGRKLVEVGKSRWWSMGGTPDEGTGQGQFRPHWLVQLNNRTQQKSTWGADEDSLSPTTKFLMENFTYELERRTYYDRPYPVSSAAFSNVPIIGGILSATIGQLVKPSRLMHGSEWMRQNEQGQQETAEVYRGWKREPSYEMGAHQTGMPMSPYDARNVFADAHEQFKDLSGLTGWASGMLTKALTGEASYSTSAPRLADASRMNSLRRSFWDLGVGEGGPAGEALRRIIPPFKKDSELVNPLRNSMPRWLPKEFGWGDPYTRVAGGESILPGAGYVALHPELAGLDPENYPLLYQYDILSQVSPKSSNLRDVRESLYFQRQQGAFNPEQEAWIDRIDEVVTKQWNALEFNPVNERAIELPGISRLTQGAWFGAREKLRAYAAPVENLTPFRPVQKFLGGDRDMIERYEYDRMYGSGGLAFWDKPFRDFLRPSMYGLANLMGYESKPAWRVQADAANKYFDELEFNKWMTLAQQAQAMGDTRQKTQYEYQAANTRMGVNPQGNPMSIYWSLPAEDRAYFNAFAFAEGKERDRVLDMIPTDQISLYQTLWSRVDSEDPMLWAGLPSDPDQDYMYRQWAGMDQGSMPPTDWIGNDPGANLRDIKIRYVDELGKDLKDYGLWENGRRQAYSQPYLEDSTAVIHQEMSMSRGGIARNLKELFGGDADLRVYNTNANNGISRMEFNDNRQGDIDRAMENYLGRY